MYGRHCLKTSVYGVYGVSWLVGLAMFTNEGQAHKKGIVVKVISFYSYIASLK